MQRILIGLEAILEKELLSMSFQGCWGTMNCKLGSSVLNLGAVFLHFVTEAFFPFLAPARVSNPVESIF